MRMGELQMEDTNNIMNICSYNSQGSGPGRMEYIAQLFNRSDFVLIQEHWLYNEQSILFEKNINNVSCCFKSGMNSSELRCGRPFGGVAILWHKDSLFKVTPVNTNSKRLCAITIKSDFGTFLLCNVYMPTGNNAESIRTEYKIVLNELIAIYDVYDTDYFIVGGDFNVSFNRSSDKHIVKVLNEYVDKLCIKCPIHFEMSQVDFTFESKVNNVKSTIDHIFVGDNLCNLVTSYVSLIDVDNFSDHNPVQIKLKLSGLDKKFESFDDTKIHKSYPCWDKADANQLNSYKVLLNDMINTIDIPWAALQCNDFFCEEHKVELQLFHNALIESCIESCKMSIPHKTNDSKNKCVPGWNENVKEYQDIALFWHGLWKDNNCPRSGYIADIRNKTRAQYHRAVKKAKNNSDITKAEKIADYLLNNKNNNFWAEVKKIKKCKTSNATTVDGVTGPVNISNLFCEKYKSLYNSVSYDEDDMCNMLDDLSHGIKHKCKYGNCYNDHLITVNDVQNGLNRLKKKKGDGQTDYMSDHLLNASPKYFILISMLFSAMLKHGFTPDGMLLSTIIPIPKNKNKSLNTSENYRAIALSSILGKLLDSIILDKNRHIFNTSDFQFGFKQAHSTTHCSFVVNEVIQYYLNNKSDVYSMLLDASKAFDKVHYCKMFKLLIKKGLCPVVARFLALMYTNQCLRVKWGTSVSEKCQVKNGVKQGGVLSPILFIVYIDELLIKLKDSGCGCYIGLTYMGSFGFADDCIILSPTLMSLFKMLKVCEEFGEDFNVSFNPQKYQLLHYTQDPGEAIEGITFNGIDIPRIDTATHLGVPLSTVNDNIIIKNATDKFYVYVNTLISFFSNVNMNTKYKLFKSFCMSLYGCVLWDFSDKYVSTFYTAWRKSIRTLFVLPYNIHSIYLPLLCEDMPVEVQLHNRLIKFVNKLNDHNNEILNLCLTLALNGSNSAFSNSISYVAYKYKLNRSAISYVEFCNSAIKCIDSKYSDKVLQNYSLLKVCLAMREDQNSKLTTQELNYVIQAVGCG